LLEWRRREALGTALEDHSRIQHKDDDDFGHGQHAEHARAHVDVAVAEEANDEQTDEHVHDPGDLRTAELDDEAGQRDRQQCPESDDDAVVAQQSHITGGPLCPNAEGCSDVLIEAARAHNPLGHRDESEREEQEQDAGHDEEAGHPGAWADRERERNAADDRGHGTDAGNDEEGDARYAERAGAERSMMGWVGLRRRGIQHDGGPPCGLVVAVPQSCVDGYAQCATGE
jgi:hypothetical protein